jgi:hypothetical protein
VWNDTVDDTKGMNRDKMDMNDKEHQKRNQEIKNREIGKLDNNKHPESKGEQHKVRNKLKEDFHIT